MTTIGRSAAVAAVVIFLGGCAQEAGQPAEVAASSGAALTQEQVLPTGGACAPTGAHGKHVVTSCKTCHVCGGVLQFDPAGPAVAAGQPAPAFDAVTKTCSNVACHSVPAGTYTYSVYDWSTETAVPMTVPYGGGAAQTTPSWYATGGSSCAACHPLPASPYNWHGGYHGGSSATNSCQLCHQDAVGFTSTAGVVSGAAIVQTSTCGPQRNQPCPPFHGNGIVDVTPQWASACIGCH